METLCLVCGRGYRGVGMNWRNKFRDLQIGDRVLGWLYDDEIDEEYQDEGEIVDYDPQDETYEVDFDGGISATMREGDLELVE